MAGVFFTQNTGEVSLSAATAKTIWELTAASNHRVLIHELLLFFKGTTVGNEPVTVELTRFAATGTGSSGTSQKKDPDYSETIQASFKYNDTVEPSSQTALKTWYIHPQSGMIYPLPINRLWPVPGGDLVGIRCTADDAVTVGLSVELEE
jgi:hypothetical protein